MVVSYSCSLLHNPETAELHPQLGDQRPNPGDFELKPESWQHYALARIIIHYHTQLHLGEKVASRWLLMSGGLLMYMLLIIGLFRGSCCCCEPAAAASGCSTQSMPCQFPVPVHLNSGARRVKSTAAEA